MMIFLMYKLLFGFILLFKPIKNQVKSPTHVWVGRKFRLDTTAWTFRDFGFTSVKWDEMEIRIFYVSGLELKLS